VGPHECKVELVRASTRQGPVRPLRGNSRAGERQRWEDAGARPVDDERVARRHPFDDPGVGPSHAPLAEVGGEFEDIHRHLEVVL
jgi:hypothetical protein